MLKNWLAIIRRELKVLRILAPEALNLFKAIRTEITVYKAKKRTANFNSVLMWKEIIK